MTISARSTSVDTRRRRRGTALAGVLPLLLVAATCDGDEQAADVRAPVADHGEAEELADAVEAGDPDDLDVAFVTAVSVEPAIAPPGNQVRITIEGHAPDATAYISYGEAEVSASLDGATATTLRLPDDAPVGLHRVRIEQDGVVVGVGELRVADGPGIWVRADRRYVAPHDVVTLTITSAGVPLDATAMLLAPPEVIDWDDDADDWDEDGEADEFDLSDLDWDAFDEQMNELFDELEAELQRRSDGSAGSADLDDWDDVDDGGAAMFRVHHSGALVPIGPMQAVAGELPTLGDLVDRPIAVPGHLADLGGFRVAAVRDLEAILNPGAGDVVWSNAATLVACEQPGEVSGTVAGPATVRATSVDGELRSATVETSGAYRLAAGPGPVIVSILPVDRTQEPEVEIVEPACGEVVEQVRAAPELPALLQTGWTDQAPGPDLPARPVSAGAAGQRCRSAFVSPSDMGGIRRGFDGVIARLVQEAIGDEAPRLSVTHPGDIRALLELEAQQQLLGAEGDGSLSHFAEMLDVDFLIAVAVGASGSDHRATVRVIRLHDLRRVALHQATGVGEAGLLDWPDFGAPGRTMRIAAACGEVDTLELSVPPREIEEFTLRVTDLVGRGAEGAEVTVTPDPECGDLLPSDQDRVVEGETLTFTFEADVPEYETCVDELELYAEWPDGLPAVVDTLRWRDDLDVRITVGGRYKVEMEFDLDPYAALQAGVPMLFGGSIHVEAYNCEYGGVLGPWEGVATVDAIVGGIDGSGEFRVVFTLPQGGGTFRPIGLEELGLEGQYYAGGDVIALTSMGMPMLVGDIELLEDEAPCGS